MLHVVIVIGLIPCGTRSDPAAPPRAVSLGRSIARAFRLAEADDCLLVGGFPDDLATGATAVHIPLRGGSI